MTSVRRTDDLFLEAGDGAGDVMVAEGRIRLKPSMAIPPDQAGAPGGIGYIITTAVRKEATR